MSKTIFFSCKLIFSLFTIFVVPVVCGAEDISWHENLQQAIQKGKTEGKPLLLHFSADFCAPCKMMEKSVFPQADVAKYVNENFIPVKIDTQKNPQISQQYQITGIPADVFMNSDGEIFHQRIGGAGAEQYLSELKNASAIAMTKSQSILQNTQIAEKSIAEPQNSVFQDSSQPVAVATPQTTAKKEPTMQMGTGAGLGAVIVANRPTSMPEPNLQNSQIVAEKPLIFDGCCPVTLQEKSRWEKGNPQISAEFEKCVFYFVSEDARLRFLATPDRFAPVASGTDIVEWTQNKKHVSGTRKLGAWYQNNVYLFSTQENFDQFKANPKFFVGQALQLSRRPSENIR